MTVATIPNRPSGGDTRSIAAILANFDALISVINGGLQADNLAAGAVTASEFGTLPRAKSSLAAAVSIPNATITPIAFNSEIYDTNTFHDNVTNNTRFTVLEAGLYIIHGFLDWAYNGTGRRVLGLRRSNSAGVSQESVEISGPPVAGGSGATRQIGSWPTVCAATDYVELYAYQESGGGALNVENAQFALEFVSK